MGKGTALAKAPKGRYPATSSIKPAPASHRQAEQGAPKGNPTPPSPHAHLTPVPSSQKEHFEETGQKEGSQY